MTLPVRYHLALILVGLNVVGASVVAAFAYRASRQSLEDQARLAVGSVAQARQQATVRLLERRQERLNAFLGNLESLCGERNPHGVLSLERECIRVALVGLRTAERATAVRLPYGKRRLAGPRRWPTPGAPATNRLAPGPPV